jgi:hypothetical protein
VLPAFYAALEDLRGPRQKAQAEGAAAGR